MAKQNRKYIKELRQQIERERIKEEVRNQASGEQIRKIILFEK